MSSGANQSGPRSAWIPSGIRLLTGVAAAGSLAGVAHYLALRASDPMRYDFPLGLIILTLGGSALALFARALTKRTFLAYISFWCGQLAWLTDLARSLNLPQSPMEILWEGKIPTHWDRIVDFLGFRDFRTIWFLTAAVLLMQIACLLARAATDNGGVDDRIKVASTEQPVRLVLPLEGPAHLGASLGVGLLYYLAWVAVDPVALVWSYLPFQSDDGLLAFEPITSPSAWVGFVLAMGYVGWRHLRYVSLQSDSTEVSFVRPDWRLFRISHSLVRRIDVIRHERRPASAVLRFGWTRLAPFSLRLSVPTDEIGKVALSKFTDRCAESGARVSQWFASDRIRWLAPTLLLLGLALAQAQQLYSYLLIAPATGHPPRTEELANSVAFLQQSLLFAGMIVAIGLSFGLSSAYHRGAIRPFLAGLFVLLVQFLPDPMVHWLVWIACYSILTARIGMTEIIPKVPFPPEWHIDVGFAIVMGGPAIAGGAYVLGVMIGVRRMKPRPA